MEKVAGSEQGGVRGEDSQGQVRLSFPAPPSHQAKLSSRRMQCPGPGTSLAAAGGHLVQLQSICSAMESFPQPNLMLGSVPSSLPVPLNSEDLHHL